MDRCDIDKLFALLAIYYPNSERVKSKVVKEAWALALTPYRYDDAKAAVAAYAARNKFFPDLYDIAGRLSPITPDESAHARMKKYLTPEYEARWHDSGVSRYAREHGMTWDAAKQELLANGLYARSEKGYPDSGRI